MGGGRPPFSFNLSYFGFRVQDLEGQCLRGQAPPHSDVGFKIKGVGCEIDGLRASSLGATMRFTPEAAHGANAGLAEVCGSSFIGMLGFRALVPSLRCLPSQRVSVRVKEREATRRRVREFFTLSLSLAQSAPGAAHGANAGLAELWG